VSDPEALAAFILRAKRATYAGQSDDASVTPLLPGSRQLEYAEGDRLYRDVYVGLSVFAGFETVTESGRLCWAMTYTGGLVAPADLRTVYAFLREALRRGDVTAPYRGPHTHDEGEWSYTNAWDGSLDRFDGAESIARAGVTVYRLRYAGGRVL
jgi:hypothetical protein